jgi:hypothetical protein
MPMVFMPMDRSAASDSNRLKLLDLAQQVSACYKLLKWSTTLGVRFGTSKHHLNQGTDFIPSFF